MVTMATIFVVQKVGNPPKCYILRKLSTLEVRFSFYSIILWLWYPSNYSKILVGLSALEYVL